MGWAGGGADGAGAWRLRRRGARGLPGGAGVDARGGRAQAAIARLLLTEGAGLSWAERVLLVGERLGSEGVSKATPRRILAAVAGVDPIDHAPALLGGPRDRAAAAGGHVR